MTQTHSPHRGRVGAILSSWRTSHTFVMGVWRGVHHFIATGAFSGLSPIMPGTIASLFFTLLVAPFVYFSYLHLYVLLLLVVVLSLLGWLSSHITLQRKDFRKDDKRIVIDEWAGQALTFVPLVVWQDLGKPLLSGGEWLVWLFLGFVSFRVFDIFKPSPISLADKKVAGAFGVMLDDLLAGLAGALFWTLAFFVWHLIP